MLTARAWWFLLTVAALLLVGVRGIPTMAMVGLTLLAWFVAEWLLFTVRVYRLVPRLRIIRELLGERGPVDTLWVGQRFTVRTEVRLTGRGSLPFVLVTDRVPFAADFLGGATDVQGALRRERPCVVEYQIQAPAVGRVRFEGVRVQIADLQGFFFHATFVNAPVTYRVMPVLLSTRGQSPMRKRHNLLPPPGIHRLHRAGTGSELLDLRDYLPGDPPKTIAWKVSARRDRLITKEFESEVPLRSTLFIDCSNSVRVGPRSGNALTRLTEIAAAVAQANAGNRDLTGLCLFDEQSAQWIAPARTTAHLAHVLNTLTDAAALAPSVGGADMDTLVRIAHPFAEEVYPQMMRGDVNSFPFWLPWIWPAPPYTMQRPRRGDRVYRWVLPLLLLYAGGSLIVILLSLYGMGVWLSEMELPTGFTRLILVLAGLGAFSFLWFSVPARVFFPRQRRQYRWRKRLAALLSVKYDLAPGGLAALLENSAHFVHYLERFLAEHQVPYPLAYYDAGGRYQFASPTKVSVLAKALSQAVARGHDNELFVLFVDVFELTGMLHPLLRAVRVALGRHHQVVVICPWPPGLRPPTTAETGRRQRRLRLGSGTLPQQAAQLLEDATAARFYRAHWEVRRAFSRLGVPVICAAGEEPVRFILQRMDRLRGLGRRR